MTIYSNFSFTVDMITTNESGAEYRTPFENRVDVRDDLGVYGSSGETIASTVQSVGSKNVENNSDGAFIVESLKSGIYSVGLAPAGGSVSYSQEELLYLPHLGKDLLAFFIAVVSSGGEMVKDEKVKVSADLISALSGSDAKTVLGKISTYIDNLKGSQVAVEDSEDNYSGSDVETVLAEIASSLGTPALSNYISDSQTGDKGWSASKINGAFGNMEFAGEGEAVDLHAKSSFTAAINALQSAVNFTVGALRENLAGITKTVCATHPGEVQTDGTAGDTQTVLTDALYIDKADARIKIRYKAKAAAMGLMYLYIDSEVVATGRFYATSYSDESFVYTIDHDQVSKGNHEIKLEIHEAASVASTVYAKLISIYKESVF